MSTRLPIAGYATQITGFYDRWREQVDTIGPLQHGWQISAAMRWPSSFGKGANGSS